MGRHDGFAGDCMGPSAHDSRLTMTKVEREAITLSQGLKAEVTSFRELRLHPAA